MNKSLIWFHLLLLMWCAGAHAQPLNDNYANATEIKISGKGFDLNTFSTSKVNLSTATIEGAEYFDSLNVVHHQNSRSVWYWFEIPTARGIRIDVLQSDTNIARTHVGVAVYNDEGTYPDKSSIDKTFPSINRFGATINSCAKPGKYYIQVCAHSKATDDIWLELTTDYSAQGLYDLPTTAYSFDTVRTKAKLEFETGCLSIGPEDNICNPGAKFTQSAWFVFSTDSNPDFFRFKLKALSYIDEYPEVFYTLFEGNSIDAFSKMVPITSCKDSLPLTCVVRPNTTYTIHMSFSKALEARFKMVFRNRGHGDPLGADPNNLDTSRVFDTLSLPFGKEFIEFLDCDSRMANYVCNNAIQKAVPFSTFDSLKLHTLITFTLTDSAVIKLHPKFFPKLPMNEDEELEAPYYTRVYEGNIAKSCNLKLVSIFNFKTCLPAGTYTLQLMVAEEYVKENFLGTLANIEFEARAMVFQKAGIHRTPQLVENLDTLSFSPNYLNEKRMVRTSDTDYFGGRDTFFRIAGTVMGGRFVFRKFYLKDPAKIKCLQLSNRFNTKNYLFKGEPSDLDKLVPVDTSLGAENPFTLMDDFISSCTELQPGWYTIITHLDMFCFRRDRLQETTIRVSLRGIPPSNYNYGKRACLVDNLNPIDVSNNYGTVENPNYRRSVRLPVAYFDCIDDLPRHFPTKCDIKTKHHAYYVFRVRDPLFICVMPGNNSSEHFLYPYDIRTDSARFGNIDNAIGACENQSFENAKFYCKLTPGIYTLAFTGEERDSIVPVMYVAPYIETINDLAKNAYDMDSLKAGINATPTMRIGCGTSLSELDYPKRYRLNLLYETLPYPIPAKQRVTQYYQGNVWFTFTIDRPGEVKIKGDIISHYKKTFKHLSPMLVYEAPAGQEIDFATLSASGLQDTTEELGLKLMDINFHGEQNKLAFNKTNCEKRRYYVVFTSLNYWRTYRLSANYLPNVNMNMTIEFTPSANASEDGDYCDNAVKLKLGDDDKTSGSINLSCHTIGESYGEDGSNMGCLGSVDEVKTSWFKVEFTGKKKTDIEFQLEETTTALPSEINYRIMTGSCAGMTPGHCVDEVSGAYKAECMVEDDYYLQLSIPQNALGNVEFTVTTVTSADQNCKPKFLGVPSARFEYETSCEKNDSIHFSNLSTQGDSISYLWDFGDGDTSVLKSPRHLYPEPLNGIDSYKVVLRVTDSVSDTTVFFSRMVYVRANLQFRLSDDLVETCGDSVIVKINRNFEPTSINWTPAHRVENPRSVSPIIHPEHNGLSTFKVIARFEECLFEDSVAINNKLIEPQKFQFYKCADKALEITFIDSLPIFKWNDGSTATEKTFDTLGRYVLTQGFDNNCKAESFVDIFSYPKAQYQFEEFDNCVGDTLRVEYDVQDNYSFLWEDSSITAYRIIYDTGWYKVKITTPDKCNTNDSFYIAPEDFLFPSMRDTYACNRPFVITAPVDRAKYKWNTGATTQQLITYSHGVYTVEITLDDCSFRDDVKIEFSNIEHFELHDTFTCDTPGINLNFYPNYTYSWSNGQKGHRVSFSNSGKHVVQLADSHCIRKDSFMLEFINSPLVDLGPDTLVCWPFSLTLKGPKAESYQWKGGLSTDSMKISELGNYWLVAGNRNCFSSDTISVELDSCFTGIYIPDAFTPGPTDEHNRFFLAKGMNIIEYRMTIYNRWGECLFTTTDLYEGWDGTFKGTDCPTDIYMYVIHYQPYRLPPKTVGGGFRLIR